MRATHDRKRYIIIRGYTANVFLFSLTDAETNGTAAQLAHATPSNIPRSLTTLIWMGDTIAAATSRGKVQYPNREHACRKTIFPPSKMTFRVSAQAPTVRTQKTTEKALAGESGGFEVVSGRFGGPAFYFLLLLLLKKLTGLVGEEQRQ